MKTFVYNKDNPENEFVGSAWLGGLASGVETTLENITEYTSGQGKIGKQTQILIFSKVTGTSAKPLQNGVHFVYGKRLDASVTEDPIDGYGTVDGGIIDINTTGELGENKFIRFIENGANFKTRGFKFRAMNLTYPKIPRGDEVWIDPANNRFSLPYNLYNYPTNRGAAYRASSGSTGAAFYPYTELEKIANKRGIISYQTYTEGGAESNDNDTEGYSLLDCYIGNNFYVRHIATCTAREGSTDYHYAYIQIYLNGACIYDWGGYGYNAWRQLTVCYNGDTEKRSGETWTARVYRSGELIYETNVPIDVYQTNGPYFYALCNINNPGSHATEGTLQAYVRYIQIWEDHLMYADEIAAMVAPSNLALIHPKYINGNTPTGLKVQYRHIPLTTPVAQLPKPTGNNQVIELEDISDYSNGVGYFGVSHLINKENYTNLIEETDFTYDTDISSLFDTGASGPLASGKILRVNHDVTNLLSMGLTPIAKEMSVDKLTPPSNQFYIDPILAKISVPIPIFWTKLESLTGITNGEIGFGTAENIPLSDYFETGSKFNYGLIASYSTPTYITPVYNWVGKEKKISSSFWAQFRHVSGSSYVANIYFYIASNIYISYVNNGSGTKTINLYKDGINLQSVVKNINFESNVAVGTNFHHFFISVNESFIKVFIDGELFINYSHSFNININSKLGFNGYFATGTPDYHVCLLKIDNLKIWNDYIDNPSFEYNSGTGREDALHPIYGAGNGYKPNLKVGYYKSSSSGNLVKGFI